jgi:hypothetical protein
LRPGPIAWKKRGPKTEVDEPEGTRQEPLAAHNLGGRVAESGPSLCFPGEAGGFPDHRCRNPDHAVNQQGGRQRVSENGYHGSPNLAAHRPAGAISRAAESSRTCTRCASLRNLGSVTATKELTNAARPFEGRCLAPPTLDSDHSSRRWASKTVQQVKSSNRVYSIA